MGYNGLPGGQSVFGNLIIGFVLMMLFLLYEWVVGPTP